MTARYSILDPDCFEYHPGFIGRVEADEYLRLLWQGLDWTQKEITIFGRRQMQPRLIAWYGDPGSDYRYSGLLLRPRPWHPALLELRQRIEKFSDRSFNSLLANAYRDGGDSMGWHSDDESELGHRPFIASLTLGEERRFLVREKGIKSTGMNLQHGSLLLMKGDCQQRYQHSLPKTTRNIGLRINLTLREVRNQAPF